MRREGWESLLAYGWIGLVLAIVLAPQPIRTALSTERNVSAELHPKQLNAVFREFAAVLAIAVTASA